MNKPSSSGEYKNGLESKQRENFSSLEENEILNAKLENRKKEKIKRKQFLR